MPLISRIIPDYGTCRETIKHPQTEDVKTKPNASDDQTNLTPKQLLLLSHLKDMRGVMVQLEMLSEYAQNIFDGLAESATSTHQRLQSLSTRVSNAVEHVDEMTEEEKIDLLVELKPKRKTSAQNMFVPESAQGTLGVERKMSKSIREQYEKCQDYPDLAKMDVYGSGESCLKKFSDPLFFVNEWIREENLRQQKVQKEIMERKQKRRELDQRAKKSKQEKENLTDQKKRLSYVRSWRDMYGRGEGFEMSRQEAMSPVVIHATASSHQLSPFAVTQTKPPDSLSPATPEPTSLPRPPPPTLVHTAPVVNVAADPSTSTLEPTNGSATKPAHDINRKWSEESRTEENRSVNILDAKPQEKQALVPPSKRPPAPPAIISNEESDVRPATIHHTHTNERPKSLLSDIQMGTKLRSVKSENQASLVHGGASQPLAPTNVSLMDQIRSGKALKSTDPSSSPAEMPSDKKKPPVTDLLSEIKAGKSLKSVTSQEKDLKKPETHPTSLLSQIQAGATLRSTNSQQTPPLDKKPLSSAPALGLLMEQIRNKQSDLRPVGARQLERKRSRYENQSSFAGTIAEILARRNVIAYESDSGSDASQDWE